MVGSVKQTWKTVVLSLVTSSDEAEGVTISMSSAISPETATAAPVDGADESLHAPVAQGIEGVDGLLAVSDVILGLKRELEVLGREILGGELGTLLGRDTIGVAAPVKGPMTPILKVLPSSAEPPSEPPDEQPASAAVPRPQRQPRNSCG